MKPLLGLKKCFFKVSVMSNRKLCIELKWADPDVLKIGCCQSWNWDFYSNQGSSLDPNSDQASELKWWKFHKNSCSYKTKSCSQKTSTTQARCWSPDTHSLLQCFIMVADRLPVSSWEYLLLFPDFTLCCLASEECQPNPVVDFVECWISYFIILMGTAVPARI